MAPHNIGYLVYHMGNYQIYNDYCLNMVEDCMDIFRNKFTERSCFGFYHGTLTLSLPKHFIYFAKNEFERFSKKKDDFTYSDLKSSKKFNGITRSSF